jgi:hypothetical protein
VALSGYAFNMAQNAGRANAVRSWKQPRLATEIVFSKDCPPTEVLKKDNELGALLLLKSTPKLYLLFSRNSDPLSSDIMDMRLYRVPAACASHTVTELRTPAR